ncbi:MAG TPA: allophanate hydrolase [Stellaceae bacterium]|nr:allophanate hydrolase [Stellaceae bacterium]
MTATASPLEVVSLRRAFLGGSISAAQLTEEVLARIGRSDDPAIWISRLSESAVRARARELDLEATADPSTVARLPLFGIPFAVKDNIDVAGMPTTAGCPAFAYTPAETAPIVARLLTGGAVLLGKTNLDQFATGLVGTRSPYGVPRNPFDARFIPGGSSSGSAVAVATGLVSFSLGTDTAGSGRIPAAFNNLVGLKPTRGLLSTRGIVPACRSLDCVSIFALTAQDASAVFDVAAFLDAADPLARAPDATVAPHFGPRFRFGVPKWSDLEFFGDRAAAALFGAAVGILEKAGGTRVQVSFAPFREAGHLLYEGPWVAERLHTTQALLSENPGAVLPITRSILEDARRYSALDAYRAQYELAALRRAVDGVFATVDVLLLPTAGTNYEIAAVAAESTRVNANLGFYTNFVNLLDLAAIAVPAGFGENGLPFGISLIAQAFRDSALLDLGTRFQEIVGLPLGAAKV